MRQQSKQAETNLTGGKKEGKKKKKGKQIRIENYLHERIAWRMIGRAEAVVLYTLEGKKGKDFKSEVKKIGRLPEEMGKFKLNLAGKGEESAFSLSRR